jgi:hypothetical protein
VTNTARDVEEVEPREVEEVEKFKKWKSKWKVESKLKV